MGELPFKGHGSGRGEVELLRALLTLANQLQASLDLDAVVRVVAAAASETFGFGEAAVLVRDGDDRLRTMAAVAGDKPLDLTTLHESLPKSAVESLFAERHRVGDCYFVGASDPDWESSGVRSLAARGPFAKGAWRRGDTLLVPLRSQDRQLRGLIRLGSPLDGARPSLATVQLLEVFATHAAVAIENALEHEQLQRVTGELEEQLQVRRDLTEMSRTLLAKLDQAAVFDEIARVLGQLVPFRFLAIALREGDGCALTPVFATGTGDGAFLEAREAVDHPALESVVREGGAVVRDREDGDPLPFPFRRHGEDSALVLAPLATSDRVFGVLGIGRAATDGFDERALELTVLVANLAAIAVHNAKTYREMQHLAISDGLTGLHNYRHFQETLAAEVRRADRYDETFCLLMMDLDHFKAVNDTVGHQKGDEVLRAVTEVLRQCSRESDYLARYGGEEFVMILPRTTLSEARHVAERIRLRVREIDAGSPALQVSMSVGVAAYPDSVADADGVLRAADAALLRAKSGGRNRIQLHGEAVSEEALARQSGVGSIGLARDFCAAVGLDEEQTRGVILTLAVAEDARTRATPVGSAARDWGPVHGVGLRWDGQGGDDRAFEALLYSTERWDGAGYPVGLSGEEIPLAARVYAVCRTYLETAADDATGALERLWQAAGDRLDPHLVQQFIAHVRSREQGTRAAVSAGA